MAGKHDWYKRDKYRKENSDYIDNNRKYDNRLPHYESIPHTSQNSNNGVNQAIQQLVGDERLVSAIQTIVERHTQEALKNIEDRLHTDPNSRRSLVNIENQKSNNRYSASGTSRSYENINYDVDDSNRHESSRSRNDIVDYFDPDNISLTIEDWLDNIDHLASVHNWTDYERCYYMQNRLTGAAKTWYNRLRTTDLLWQEWKSALISTFSTRLDYANMVTEMLARKKKPNETMLQYFNDKVRLCERCEFSNDKIVSFIIYGLPKEFQAEARAFRCWTPNELYDEFLVKLDKATGAHRTPEPLMKSPKEMPIPSEKYYSSNRTSNSNDPLSRNTNDRLSRNTNDTLSLSRNTNHSHSHNITKRHHSDHTDNYDWDNKRRSTSSIDKNTSRSHSSKSQKLSKLTTISSSQQPDIAQCYNCLKSDGHISKNCPHPKVWRECRDCGSKNHRHGDCKASKSSRNIKR